MSLQTADIIGYTLAGVFGAVIGFFAIAHLRMMVLVAFRRRRWRSRARRGLCIHCKHSMAGLETDQCPECGKDGRLSSPTNRAKLYFPNSDGGQGGAG